MTHLYFVRHGRTQNKDNIIYGRMPGYPLSKEGLGEAERAGNILSNKGITRIYTSPLSRAVETAGVIQKYCPATTVEEIFDLNETESNAWQGMLAEKLFTNDIYEKFINDPNAEIGTENLNQVAARMNMVVNQILKDRAGENVVLVSHEFPILALKFFLEKKQLSGVKTYHLPTGGVMDFTFDNNDKFVSTEIISV